MLKINLAHLSYFKFKYFKLTIYNLQILNIFFNIEINLAPFGIYSICQCTNLIHMYIHTRGKNHKWHLCDTRYREVQFRPYPQFCSRGFKFLVILCMYNLIFYFFGTSGIHKSLFQKLYNRQKPCRSVSPLVRI